MLYDLFSIFNNKKTPLLHEKAKGQSNNQIGILLIKAPISLGRDLSIYYIPIMINKTCLKNFSRQKLY